MPDHIHLLITIHSSDGHPRRGVPTYRTSEIARFIGTFKRFCNREYGENIWQARYYDHIIRNQQDYNEITEYIETNPLRCILNKYGYEYKQAHRFLIGNDVLVFLFKFQDYCAIRFISNSLLVNAQAIHITEIGLFAGIDGFKIGNHLFGCFRIVL